MASTSSFYTVQENRVVAGSDQRYQTPAPSNKFPEVAQEALINSMMGFGRQGRAALVITDEDDCSRPTRPASVRSQPYPPNRSPPSFAAVHEDDGPVGITSDPDLFYSIVGGDDRRAMALPLRANAQVNISCTTPEAEDFYRSSSPYRKWAEERKQKHAVDAPRSNRPLTPFPRSISRRYATLPLPSAQEREYIDNAMLSSQYPRPLPRQRRHQRSNPPPACLPNTFRASTPFSFDRPPTTTPFSSAGGRLMSPGHWLYNAPRVGGVQLEVRALQQATEGRGAVHRALWPEEREEMLGEVDGMAGRLVQGAGVVRDDGDREGWQQIDEEAVGQKKTKRIGWWKKLWGGKKPEKKEYGTGFEETMAVMSPARDDIWEEINVTCCHQPHVCSGTVRPSVRYDAASAKQEKRNFSNDTTIVASSTPTMVTDTPSPTQLVREAKVVKQSTSTRLQKHKTRRRYWWQIVSRGRLGYKPTSQEMLRQQTSLVIPKSQRRRVRHKAVIGSNEKFSGTGWTGERAAKGFVR